MVNQETVMEILSYDKDTGIFTWITRRSLRVLAGHVAGSVSKRDGYNRIFIDGKSYLAHRLAWLIVNGSFPTQEIDHIDHNRSNNKWANIRLAGKVENMRNTSKKRNNTSGFNGVYWHKESGKWAAQIKIAGKNKRIGLFDTKEGAVAVRQVANCEHGFHELHGR